jgi:ubiquinone/menaquinone biosynthesis C-methylase UbiE
MTAEGSYRSDRQPLEFEAELARLKAQAHIIWEKELRTLHWFGLRDDMKILEAGSGPGFITELLLNALPHSTVTAVENDYALAEYVEGYLHAQGHDRYQIVEASITDSGLPDNTFDFAYARFLYQHLPDPYAPTRELFRVLKPGGVLVIHDRDSGLKALRAPENPVIEQVYLQAEAQQAAWGGNPKVGRQLWRILSNCGFVNLDLELLAIHSDAADVEAISWLRPDMVEKRLSQGMTSNEQGQVLLQALKDVNSSPDKYVLQPNLLVAGRKPA